MSKAKNVLFCNTLQSEDRVAGDIFDSMNNQKYHRHYCRWLICSVDWHWCCGINRSIRNLGVLIVFSVSSLQYALPINRPQDERKEGKWCVENNKSYQRPYCGGWKPAERYLPCLLVVLVWGKSKKVHQYLNTSQQILICLWILLHYFARLFSRPNWRNFHCSNDW